MIKNAVLFTSYRFFGFLQSVYFREHLKEAKVEVVPTYKVGYKEQVKEGQPAVWTPRKNLPEVTNSYHNYMVDTVIEDLMQHVLQVHDRAINEEDVSVLLKFLR